MSIKKICTENEIKQTDLAKHLLLIVVQYIIQVLLSGSKPRKYYPLLFPMHLIQVWITIVHDSNQSCHNGVLVLHVEHRKRIIPVIW